MCGTLEGERALAAPPSRPGSEVQGDVTSLGRARTAQGGREGLSAQGTN